MRRWTAVRIVGLAAVAVVGAGVLYQLPASPFDRGGKPERPVVAQSEPSDKPAVQKGDPAPKPKGDPGDKPADPPAENDQSSTTPDRPAAAITYPQRGTVNFTVLPADPAHRVIGRAGRLMTFQIAIEGGIKGINQTELAEFVRTTYGAPQGWTAGGKWRFQQVGPGEQADFRLMFVTPETRDTYCGFAPDRYTSCRIGDRVVLNIARWVNGVPNYGASLTTYRQYMVNHETGHRLGNAHQLCPGAGQPAPVMQQQTLGLHGCTAYPWPYRDGSLYRGQLGKYNDSIPGT
ncbi:DUF3152 domain-containing protein [Kribbella antibiotica]|uniref:DUF3152 domain-containing protein n=1 Tax=Kribbella antibiotica TaxID=190195 RepID=A0A4R4YQC8_9ACTN|nr:DUF3152 domain-containing protein [Kribbella antibiotica]TDD47351.1 DUF3152 domain-containing protein [Kribbella antibiotica]